MHYLRDGTFACALTLVVTSGFGQELVFHHNDGLSVDERSIGFFSAWNPTGTKALLEPGVKVVFFGSAPACDSQVAAGPITANSHYSIQDLSQDTGLPADAAIENELLTPAADPAHCNLEPERQREGSFVILGSKEGHTEIGLYTTVGPDGTGRHPLIDTFDAKGQSGSGANVGIAGTFVLFRFDWEKATLPTLWQATQARNSQGPPVLQIQTTQTLATATLGKTSGDRNSPIKQVKQQLTVTLINRDCRRALPEKPCQIQYLLTLGILRSGVTDWSKVGWFQTARVWIDPAQGNMPVIDAPIRPNGQATQDTSRKFDLYASAGEETAHSVFQDKVFRIQLGFNQFQNAVRLATAIELKRTVDAVSGADVAQIFGPRFNDPTSWSLIDVEVGQEIYNAKPDSEAHIGGSFKEIAIGPTRR